MNQPLAERVKDYYGPVDADAIRAQLEAKVNGCWFDSAQTIHPSMRANVDHVVAQCYNAVTSPVLALATGRVLLTKLLALSGVWMSSAEALSHRDPVKHLLLYNAALTQSVVSEAITGSY